MLPVPFMPLPCQTLLLLGAPGSLVPKDLVEEAVLERQKFLSLPATLGKYSSSAKRDPQLTL